MCFCIRFLSIDFFLPLNAGFLSVSVDLGLVVFVTTWAFYWTLTGLVDLSYYNTHWTLLKPSSDEMVAVF